MDATGNFKAQNITGNWRTLYNMTSGISTFSNPITPTWNTNGAFLVFTERISASFYFTSETTIRFGAFVNMLGGRGTLFLRLEIWSLESGSFQAVDYGSPYSMSNVTGSGYGYVSFTYTFPTSNTYITANKSLYVTLADSSEGGGSPISYTLAMVTIDIK